MTWLRDYGWFVAIFCVVLFVAVVLLVGCGAPEGENAAQEDDVISDRFVAQSPAGAFLGSDATVTDCSATVLQIQGFFSRDSICRQFLVQSPMADVEVVGNKVRVRTEHPERLEVVVGRGAAARMRAGKGRTLSLALNALQVELSDGRRCPLRVAMDGVEVGGGRPLVLDRPAPPTPPSTTEVPEEPLPPVRLDERFEGKVLPLESVRFHGFWITDAIARRLAAGAGW